MIVTKTRVGDHICKMSELFYYFSNCWSGYECTFSRDPLQRSNMFSNDKTVINTRHIVYCNDQTSRKKQQNLSKFEVAIRIACTGCRSASSLVSQLA